MRSVLLKTVIANLIGPLSTFLAAPILAQGLGASARGELAASTMPLTLVAAALTLGLPESLAFYLSGRRSDYVSARNKSFIILFIAGLLGSAALLGLSSVLGGGNVKVTKLISYSCIFAVPSIIMWASRGLSQGMQLWNRLNAEKIIVGVSRLAAIIILIVIGKLNLESTFIVYVLAPLTGFCAYINLKKSALKRIDPNAPRMINATLLRFGLRVWWGSLAGILLTRLDQVLMLTISTDTELGYYSAAATVADIPLIITAAVSTLLLSREAESPKLSRTTQASRLTLWLVLAGVTATGTTAYWWFPWAFGQEFAPGIPSLLILLVSMALTAPSSVAGSFMTARERPTSRSISLVMGLAVNMVLFFALVPRLGALGAALATAGGQLVVVIANLTQMRIYFGVQIYNMVLPNREDLSWARETLSLAIKKLKPKVDHT